MWRNRRFLACCCCRSPFLPLRPHRSTRPSQLFALQSCNAAGEDCRVSYATFDIKWESQIQARMCCFTGCICVRVQRLFVAGV